MGKFLRLAFLCCIAMWAAGSLYAQGGKTVWVAISDQRGNPLPKVIVKSEDSGIAVETTSSGRIGVPVPNEVRIGELIRLIIISPRYTTATGGPFEARVVVFNQRSAAIPITLLPKTNATVRANKPKPVPRPQPEDEDFQKGQDALRAQRFNDALVHLLKSAEVRKRQYEKTPNKSAAAKYAEVNTELCLAYMVLNKWNDAFERIQEAKRVNPTDEVKGWFGIVALTMGDLPQAELVFRELASSKNSDLNRPLGSMMMSEIYKMYGKLDESARFDKDFTEQFLKHKLSESKELDDLLKIAFEIRNDFEKDGDLRELLMPVYATAVIIFHKADIALTEKKSGAYSPELTQSLLNLATSLQWRGRYDEAGRHINRANLIFKRLIGPSHVWMWEPLKKLAEFEIATKQYEKAEAHYLEIAQILEQSLGPDNRWMDGIDEELATLYELLDREDEAEARWQNSRKRNCVRDVNKMGCLRALMSLSEFYRFEEKFPEAIAAGREAVELAKSLWAAKDQVGTTVLLKLMGDLEFLYSRANQHDEVTAIQKERQEIEDLGVTPAEKEIKTVQLALPERPIVQLNGYRCRSSFPNGFLAYSKSRPLLETANRAAKHLDSRDPDVTELHYSRALAYFNDDRLVEAERLATATISANEAGLEPNRRTTSLLLGLRADVRAERGDLTGAAADYSQALKILEILNSTSERNLDYLFQLSKVQIAQKKYEEAEKNLKRALDLRETGVVIICYEPDSVTLSIELANLYVLTSRLPEAEDYFKKALNAIEKFLPEYPYSVYVLENYARCLRQLGKVDEAIRLEAEAEKLKPKKQ